MPEMQTDREVYPNAPLQLVAAEWRYPMSPRLASSDALAGLHSLLGDTLPVPEPIAEQTVAFGGADMPPELSTRQFFRFTNKQKTLSASITPTATTVEATVYEHFEQFRELLERVVFALTSYSVPVGLERVGLRYIDEVRVPTITEPPGDWRRYIADELLAPPHLGVQADGGLRPTSWRGLIEFDREEEFSLVLRYGAVAGFAVNPAGALHLPRGGETGPFFLVDVDSYWTPSEAIADFDPEILLKTFDTLHAPVSAVFEALITDDLRNEVLRKEHV
jgi:uncharacterized protein (TIGR04255 family)